MPAMSDEVDPCKWRPIFQPHIDEFGGAERSVLGLADWLYEQRLPSYLLTYGDKCGVTQYAKHPLHVVTLKNEGGAMGEVKALRKHLRLRGKGAPALLCSGYQASLHATLAGEQGFHTLMHDTPDMFSPPAKRGVKERLRITVTNAILRYGMWKGETIVTSSYLQADSRKCFGVKAKIARMGGMGAETRADGFAAVDRLWESGEPLRLLSVCRIEESKRIDWLLEGLAGLQKHSKMPLERPLGETSEWHLDVVGKGSQTAALKTMAEQLGIAERVQFHGFVSDEELETLYMRTHLFLMPALQGYGIPAVEAISRGIPVLLHRESGVSDVLLDTPWATVLFGGRERTEEALASAIHGVLTQSNRGAPRPMLPTEAEWAERVSMACGWVNDSPSSGKMQC